MIKLRKASSLAFLVFVEGCILPVEPWGPGFLCPFTGDSLVVLKDKSDWDLGCSRSLISEYGIEVCKSAWNENKVGDTVYIPANPDCKYVLHPKGQPFPPR